MGDISTEDILLAEVDDLFADERQKQPAAQADDQELDLIFENVLRTESGRRFVWWLLEQGHIFHTTFTGNSLSNFKEGERHMALKVLHRTLRAQPTFFSKMLEDRITPEEEPHGS